VGKKKQKTKQNKLGNYKKIRKIEIVSKMNKKKMNYHR